MPETRRPRRKRPGLPPLLTQCQVALGQLGHARPAASYRLANAEKHGELATLLTELLDELATSIGCAAADLQLDHEPMLRRREYRARPGKPIASWYTPHAHDPAHLLWRSKRPQDADSHHTKTYVRGPRGQLPDVMLANRERRHEKDPGRWLGLRGLKKPKHKRKHKPGPKRAIRSRGFPPAGSRPFRGRAKR